MIFEEGLGLWKCFFYTYKYWIWYLTWWVLRKTTISTSAIHILKVIWIDVGVFQLYHMRDKNLKKYILPSGEDSGRSKVSSDFYGNYFCSRKLGWPKRKFDDKEILTIFDVPSLVCTFTLWTRSLFHNNNLLFLKWNVISAENGNKVDLENLNSLRFIQHYDLGHGSFCFSVTYNCP